MDKTLEKLFELIEDLVFDYDRMSTSGQETCDEIMTIVAELMKGE